MCETLQGLNHSDKLYLLLAAARFKYEVSWLMSLNTWNIHSPIKKWEKWFFHGDFPMQLSMFVIGIDWCLNLACKFWFYEKNSTLKYFKCAYYCDGLIKNMNIFLIHGTPHPSQLNTYSATTHLFHETNHWCVIKQIKLL